MARSLARASSQYLAVASSPVSQMPLTVAMWFRRTANVSPGEVHYLFGLGKAGDSGENFEMRLTDSEFLSILSVDGGTTVAAGSTVTALNTWSHAAAVYSSSTSKIAYLNGGNVGNLTTSSTPIGIDLIGIGCSYRNGSAANFWEGGLAHIGIWNVALTATEVGSLYNNGIGADPSSVRPDALVAYWPLLNNDGDQDYWGNYHLTANGSPTYAQHPPVLMRSRPKYVVIGAASGAPTISSVTITGTRTVSNTLTANVVTNPGTVDSIAYQWEIADDGSGTNAADLSGETAATLALTYADFASRLDANGEAYVRVGAIATVGVESSAESFSDWVRVTAGGSGVVRPIGQSVYISV